MKTLILIFIVSLTGTFSQGWDKGYKVGYCVNDPFCISPIAPIAPIPTIWMNTYENGYAMGVVRGKHDRDSIDNLNKSK